MKIPKYICAKCKMHFTRRWNANRHCNNKHSGAIENIISFTTYIMNQKDYSIPLNGSSHQSNVKNQLFFDNQISVKNNNYNNKNLQFNNIAADPFDDFIDDELSSYHLLEPLSLEYEEMQSYLASFPEPQKQALLSDALISAINSEHPKETMHKKLLEYRKMKSSRMILNDLTAYFGQDKEYVKEFLKLKLKSNKKIIPLI
jgi:hypothetical protein